MVSHAHQNRLNAQKSTGPTTPEGKARSSMNALKHGVFSAKILVDGDDPQELAMFRIEMFHCLIPDDVIQLQLAEQYIRAAWKLRRLQSSEVVLYNDRTRERKDFFKTTPNAPEVTPAYVMADFMWQNPQVHRMQGYEQRLINMMHKALTQLRKLQQYTGRGTIQDFFKHLIETEKSKLQNEPDRQDPAVSEASAEAYEISGEPTLPPQRQIDRPVPAAEPGREAKAADWTG